MTRYREVKSMRVRPVRGVNGGGGDLGRSRFGDVVRELRRRMRERTLTYARHELYTLTYTQNEEIVTMSQLKILNNYGAQPRPPRRAGPQRNSPLTN
ncbi:hypothetical protein EVAR_78446_1 [Eumeta japonica]|uniref:Uncharacterized protein n=1 Tax=Eumeta variegata TaxID=151549 RepID=A0A4C1TYH9_EUMVA|nr:hypothetical protein EVAR_78446_1 [Eumeta japonica]